MGHAATMIAARIRIGPTSITTSKNTNTSMYINTIGTTKAVAVDRALRHTRTTFDARRPTRRVIITAGSAEPVCLRIIERAIT